MPEDKTIEQATPAGEQTEETRPAGDTRTDDQAEIEAILGGKPTDDSESDDPALIRSRDDYLRKLNKLNDRERALKEREDALASKEGQEKKPDEKTEPEVDPETQRQALMTQVEDLVKLDIDPLDFEGPESKQLASALVKVQGLLKNTLLALTQVAAQAASGTQQIQAAQQDSVTVHVQNIMNEAAEKLTQQYGVVVTPDDVGDAILEHMAPTIQKAGGRITLEHGLQAWKMANVDLLLGERKSESDGKPAPKPPTRTQDVSLKTPPKDDIDAIMEIVQTEANRKD